LTNVFHTDVHHPCTFEAILTKIFRVSAFGSEIVERVGYKTLSYSTGSEVVM